MKKILLCATAMGALASVGSVASADEGWYQRVDVGYTFTGLIDHDAETSVPLTLAGNSNTSGLWGGWLGVGYDFENSFRLEAVSYTHLTLPTIQL